MSDPEYLDLCWEKNKQGENIRFSLIHHLKRNIQQLVSAGKSQETDNITKTSLKHMMKCVEYLLAHAT